MDSTIKIQPKSFAAEVWQDLFGIKGKAPPFSQQIYIESIWPHPQCGFSRGGSQLPKWSRGHLWLHLLDNSSPMLSLLELLFICESVRPVIKCSRIADRFHLFHKYILMRRVHVGASWKRTRSSFILQNIMQRSLDVNT